MKRWQFGLLLGILGLVGLAALLAPQLAPYHPLLQLPNGLDELGMPLPPTAYHWLGTDSLGRDVLSRLLFGARISLWIGLSATLLTGLIGVGVGIFSGYFGGWVDAVLMRITEVVMAFPVLLLAIGLAAVLPPSPWMVILTLGLVGWTSLARVVRALVLGIRQSEYIVAAEALGAQAPWVLRRHVLPNIMAPVGALLTLKLADMLLLEASLSFLGLGIRPPAPSWGAMIHEGMALYRTAPWLVMAPGLLIVLVVLSCNLIGEKLR